LEKKLGKIHRVRVGHCGYQDSWIGIYFHLEGEDWGVSDTMGVDDPRIIGTKSWTEEDRDKKLAEIMRYISKLLYQAEVPSVDKLVGIPVEVSFQNNVLQTWRILEEVL